MCACTLEYVLHMHVCVFTETTGIHLIYRIGFTAATAKEEALLDVVFRARVSWFRWRKPRYLVIGRDDVAPSYV